MKYFLMLFILLLSHSALACISYIDESPIHITRVDLNCKNLELIGSSKIDSVNTVSTFAEKYHTEVAINANFYWKDYTPIGLVISNGKRWSKYGDTRSRVIFFCDKANHCQIEEKGKVTPYNLNWQVAISGWHWFNAKNGKFECAESDKIGCSQDIFSGKHPRTMLGLNEDKNWLYLVAVEGRQLSFRGVTLDELGSIAQKLNLTKAINLDGGGSTTMVIGNKRVNSLPILQNEERKVANHFGVRFKQN